MAGIGSSVTGVFQVSDMKLKIVEDRGVQEESVNCTRWGIGNWAAKVAHPCGAPLRWPAKMREAGDANSEPRNEANHLGSIIQLTTSALRY